MSIKIALSISTAYDVELLEQDISCRLVRIYCNVSFEKETGWSQGYKAIVDTGSPLSLIPRSIWEDVKLERISNKEFPLYGIALKSAQPVLAGFARLKMVMLDPRQVSRPFETKSYLLPDDHIPLVLGIEDILTETVLHCDYKNRLAYMEIG